MAEERLRAMQMGYSDPIMATLEDTHRNFDQCLSLVIDVWYHGWLNFRLLNFDVANCLLQ